MFVECLAEPKYSVRRSKPAEDRIRISQAQFSKGKEQPLG